jgi:para-nitrobenzyl esterase
MARLSAVPAGRTARVSAGPAAALVAALLLPAASATSASAAGGDLVTVAQGSLRGKVAADHREFLNIPFAAPPTGRNRFRPPQPAAPWPGVRDATREGNICPQGAPLGTISEDCLVLNVFTPPADVSRVKPRDLPVMVWLHGGAYILGSGAGYQATRLVQQDVVVVTVNYRFGPFGFLALPELAAESGTTGNYGLLDQQAALRWVRANIGAFGGDPGNVTIFGESAGGHSVCMNLISPTARGLFDRAISESGGCVGTALGPAPPATAVAHGVNLASAVGCLDPATVVTCLRGVSTQDLIALQGGFDQGLAWVPTIDGTVIREPAREALTSGRYNRVPLLSGTNKDEGRLFTFLFHHVLRLSRASAADLREELAFRRGATPSPELVAAYPPRARDDADLALSQVTTDGAFACPGLFLARAAASQPGQAVYQYEFADPDPPGSDIDPLMPLDDFHGAEVSYLFDTFQGLRLTLDAAQAGLSRQMIGYWTAFARTGDPNATGLPRWPAFTSSSQQAQRLTSTGTAPFTTFAKDHNCTLWE